MPVSFHRGFTLIELLVVIAIIGLLSSVVLASLNGARKKARDARRWSDMKQVQLALELYADDHGAYPPSGAGGDYLGNPANPIYSALLQYMSSTPTDPSNPPSSGYVYCAAQGDYALIVAMEKNPGAWCLIGKSGLCGWNYSSCY